MLVMATKGTSNWHVGLCTMAKLMEKNVFAQIKLMVASRNTQGDRGTTHNTRGTTQGTRVMVTMGSHVGTQATVFSDSHRRPVGSVALRFCPFAVVPCGAPFCIAPIYYRGAGRLV